MQTSGDIVVPEAQNKLIRNDLPTENKNSSTSIIRQGLPCKNRAVDNDVWQWRNSLLKLRGGKLVTKSEVQNYAREAYSKAGILNFKASDGWYRRWLSRRMLLGLDENDKDKPSTVNEVQNKQSNAIMGKKLEICKEELYGSKVTQKYKYNEIVHVIHEAKNADSVLTSMCEQRDSINNGKKMRPGLVKLKESNDVNLKKTHESLDKGTEVNIDDPLADDLFYSSILENNFTECNNFFEKNKSETPLNFVNNRVLLDKDAKKNSKVTSSSRKEESVSCVRRKGERYLPHFKTKVVTFAMSSTIKAAAAKFNVNRRTVSEWLKEKQRNVSEQKILPPVENKETADVVFLNWLKIHEDGLSRQLIAGKSLELLELYGEITLHRTCPWFLAYIKRLNEKKFDQKQSRKKYIIYPEKFKLQVVSYAQKFSQLSAARLFLIARKRVFEWLSKVKNTGTVSVKSRPDPSSYVTDPVVESNLWDWYKEQAVTPSSKQVREKGRQLYKNAGYTLTCSHGWYYRWRSRSGLPKASSESTTHDPYILEWILTKLDNNENISHCDILSMAATLKKSSSNLQFESSLGWALRFCKRYPQLLQTVPGVTVQLPAAMEAKVEKFKINLLTYIKEGNFALENIVSMDEIPLHFLLPGNNKRKLLIRRPGFDTCQASLVISSLADGTLLPFLLILKGTDHYSIPEWRSSNNIVIMTGKGCLDADIMMLWLQQVYIAQIVGGGILINDCFEYHTYQKVVEKLAANNIHHALIPGGCSSRLQPLNHVGQLLKQKVEQYWTESLNLTLNTKCWADGTNHLKSASYAQIMDWVQKSHYSLAVIEKENIKKAFQQIYCLADCNDTALLS